MTRISCLSGWPARCTARHAPTCLPQPSRPLCALLRVVHPAHDNGLRAHAVDGPCGMAWNDGQASDNVSNTRSRFWLSLTVSGQSACMWVVSYLHAQTALPDCFEADLKQPDYMWCKTCKAAGICAAWSCLFPGKHNPVAKLCIDDPCSETRRKATTASDNGPYQGSHFEVTDRASRRVGRET